MLQTIYDRSPVFVQNAMTSAKGYQISRSRYQGVYQSHRRWLEEFDTWSFADKSAHQVDLLRNFLSLVYARSDYYRNAFDAEQAHPMDISDIADLRKFPELTKDQVRRHSNQMQPNNLQGRLQTAHTGGTTGKSLTISMTVADVQRRNAMLDHFKARVGFEHLKMRRASFTGKHMVPPTQSGPPFSRLNLAGKQLLLSSFNLNDRTAAAYLADLDRFSPDSIDGFPSGMTALASYMIANGIRLKRPPVAIFPTAETLTDVDKATLESAFESRVYNQYASSEGAPFITECAARQLHVEMSTGVFEYQADGEIVVTAFDTLATPLIRYRIGDSAAPSSARDCSCGIQSEMVAAIMGRTSEFLYRADGTRVHSANISNVLKNVPNAIVEAQFVQREVGTVELSIVVDANSYQPHFDEILLNEFRHKFDMQSVLVIHRVDRIPRERSGKRLFLKNLVGQSPAA